ncbi:latrophilin Cirl [Phlebotomus argentipes]|uniref:latrophilin Cirl n=1 Tax=Phlebotomus argentipes TaxID=94469 RepID=UPI0028934CAD|nr:latrophilin Cirl [Phlebotomus argentipes]
MQQKSVAERLMRLWMAIIIIPAISLAAGSKYETAYACEGKTLTLECDPGNVINLIRANYGRFSITICNDHGNVEWSVNCMSPKSLRVLHTKCALKHKCSVLASTSLFGDPCAGTHKYLEAHYQCISATQTPTTTGRSPPPWLITSPPSVWSSPTMRSTTEPPLTAVTSLFVTDSTTESTDPPMETPTPEVPPTVGSINRVMQSALPEESRDVWCGPTTTRNMFWNVTRAGDVNVQSCPGGATGIAKWRCVLNDTELPMWQPSTPDLAQCRSLWLNNLEIRVNMHDSSIISIANDLSQVTSSKTLYGGDMLVTTKIIQSMSNKMAYDIETFPDQKQREAIVYELLHSVVRTAGNLLDATQAMSWLDLSHEDQMRVATSLLTGLEENAFLLADTIIREQSVVQRVKNILLSIRVLETRNIATAEIFPDFSHEQWTVSRDTIELPRASLIDNSEGGLVRIVFVAFDRLENILKPPATDYLHQLSLQIGNQSIGVTKDRVLNSKVISASLGKGRHIQLSQPIRLTFQHLQTENVSQPTCVFWSYIDHAWSEDGCHVEMTNTTHTMCSCNHLTNFAILMDRVAPLTTNVTTHLNRNVLIMIYISISLCILFVVIALAIFKLYNGQFLKVSEQSQSIGAQRQPYIPPPSFQTTPSTSETQSRLLTPLPNSTLAAFTLLANFNNVHHHHHHLHHHLHHHHTRPRVVNVIRNNLESLNMDDVSV